jgi:NAD+ synthase (glutamine-hydrolysing)
MDELIKLKPQSDYHLSASPFSYQQYEERMHVVRANCLRYDRPIRLPMSNQVGAQTELIFDGGSVVVDAKGELARSCHFLKKR